jgi:hypothetical protein
MNQKTAKTINESFQILDELLQKVNDIVYPFSYRDELKAIMDKQTRHNLFEKYPRCFLPINIGNKDAFILPICNRAGATDRNMIAFSKKFANRLLDRPDVNRGMLEITMKKLDRMDNKYSKEPVRPADMAARKGNSTKSLNKIKDYIHNLKGELG